MGQKNILLRVLSRNQLKNIGKRIKTKRILKGPDPSDLAGYINISLKEYQNIEESIQYPHLVHTAVLSDILDINLHKILDFDILEEQQSHDQSEEERPKVDAPKLLSDLIELQEALLYDLIGIYPAPDSRHEEELNRLKDLCTSFYRL